MVATEALLDGNQLSLTQLGRNISGAVAPKHNIKRIDRLLGNPHLHSDKGSTKAKKTVWQVSAAVLVGVLHFAQSCCLVKI